MIRRSTVRLPLAILVVVAAGLAAVMLGRPEAGLFAMPWVVVLVLGLTATGDRQVGATIGLVADRVLVGDDVELEVTLRNDGDGWIEVRPRPAAGFWADAAPADDRRPQAVADIVSASRETVLSCRFPTSSWGAHDVGRFEVTLHEPYGLFTWTGVVHEARPVRVHPEPRQLSRLLTPRLVRGKTGAHDSSAVARGVEFADIRPFGSGDSQRDINWRASARANRLMASQRHPERATDVVLLLDSFVESGHDVRAIVGLAIEAAIALAQNHLGLTDRVGLVELGGVIRWVDPGTGRVQLQRLTDALLGTRLYANATERDLSIVPRRGLPPRSFVVALSPLLDPRFIQALLVLRGAGHDVATIECVHDVVDRRAHRSDVAPVALRLFEAEQAVVRDRLAASGIAVGRWHRGQPLDPVMAELIASRRRVARVAR